jgi:tRNA 2-thiouridine synthesizing protein A
MGMKCPQPVLKLAEKLPDMNAGDVLDLVGDCLTFERDVRIWCERLQKVVLSVKAEGVYKKTIQIQF